MFNFIDALLEHTKDTESPTEWWRWAALSAISATLRDNVYIRVPKIGNIYANTYIILYSESGIRKGAPCKFAKKLIEQVGNTKFIKGRASMQGVIKELALVKNGANRVLKGASALLYSEELSSFAIEDPATIPLLTDLYDFHTEWDTNLVSYDCKLQNVCLSMLAGSNSKLFKSVYTDQANTGGLLGRTLIVKEETLRQKKSLFEFDELPEDNEKEERLVQHLQKLAELKGAMRPFNVQTAKYYNDWYNSIPDEIFYDRIGFGQRLGTHVAKVAMLLACARDDFSLYIEKADFEQAINLVQGLRRNYQLISASIGGSPVSKQSALVIKAIMDVGHIGRKQLILHTFGEIADVTQLDAILLLLMQGGLIQEVGLHGEPGYKLTALGENKFGAIKEGKK